MSHKSCGGALGAYPPLHGEGTGCALLCLHTPLGVDIGAETPEEIAVSVVAQLVAVRHGKAIATMSSMPFQISKEEAKATEESPRSGS